MKVIVSTKKQLRLFARFPLILGLMLLMACAQPKNYPLIPVPKTQPPAKAMKRPSVALVLGGGGAKGIVHVGVLEVLEKNGIPIDMIVGTSIGSAIGALYADSLDVASLKKIVMSTSKQDLLDFSLSELAKSPLFVTGPVRGAAYERFLHRHLTAKTFDALKIPLVVVTTDIGDNKAYLIEAGPIAPAVHASSAIPPYFAPVDLYGRKLIDGGVISPVAVSIARTYQPDLVIAVDISSPPPKSALQNMPALLYRAGWIYYYELSRHQGALADIDIHPDLSGHGLFDDSQKTRLYEFGKQATEALMPQIKEKLSVKRQKTAV